MKRVNGFHLLGSSQAVFKTIMTICICITALLPMGCTSIPQPDLPGPQTMNGVRVETDGTYKRGYTTVVGITGTATNQTGRDLGMCAIHFDAMNSENEKVADAIAVTQGLEAGGKWRFQAVFTTPFSSEFESVRLRRIDAR